MQSWESFQKNWWRLSMLIVGTADQNVSSILVSSTQLIYNWLLNSLVKLATRLHITLTAIQLHEAVFLFKVDVEPLPDYRVCRGWSKYWYWTLKRKVWAVDIPKSKLVNRQFHVTNSHVNFEFRIWERAQSRVQFKLDHQHSDDSELKYWYRCAHHCQK